MNDRDLLLLSAKAAGHLTREDKTGVWVVEKDGSPLFRWNPLASKIQAMDLLVGLKIDVHHYNDAEPAYVECFGTTGTGDDLASYESSELLGSNSLASLCRAIVRVAAAIGDGDQSRHAAAESGSDRKELSQEQRAQLRAEWRRSGGLMDGPFA